MIEVKRSRGRPKKVPDDKPVLSQAIRDWDTVDKPVELTINICSYYVSLMIILFLELSFLILAASVYLAVRI